MTMQPTCLACNTPIVPGVHHFCKGPARIDWCPEIPVLGFDVAAERDWAALTWLGYQQQMSTGLSRFRVRQIARVKLEWRALAIWAKETIHKWGLAGIGAHMALDVTGAGAPFYRMLLEEDPGVIVHGICITPGHEESERPQVNGWNVAKANLPGPFKAAIQRGRFICPPTEPFAHLLMGEMDAFEFTVTESNNVKFSARVGAHDDILLSVMMAIKLTMLCYIGPMQGAIVSGGGVPQNRDAFIKAGPAADPYREDGTPSPKQVFGTDREWGGDTLPGSDVPSNW